ncbi:MAG: hypothetical protein RR929_01125 [Erysipelotrichaceae bacterium]
MIENIKMNLKANILLKKYMMNQINHADLDRYEKNKKFYRTLFIAVCLVAILLFMLAIFFSNVSIYNDIIEITADLFALILVILIPIEVFTTIYYSYLKYRISYYVNYEAKQHALKIKLKRKKVDIKESYIKKQSGFFGIIIFIFHTIFKMLVLIECALILLTIIRTEFMGIKTILMLTSLSTINITIFVCWIIGYLILQYIFPLINIDKILNALKEDKMINNSQKEDKI